MRFQLLLVFLWIPSALLADLPKDPTEYASWQNETLRSIESQKNNPPEEAIPKLGEYVRKLALPYNRELDDSRPVFHAAQDLLLSIPGHAVWYGAEIKRLTDEEIARTSREHTSKRGWYSETLAQLPSAETVGVLGEMLFDERDPWKDIPTDARWVPSCYYAVEALHKLGLRNRPVSNRFSDARKDLHTWQLWFEQVRAGTKTFSFEGNPQEYSLRGPVTMPATAARERSLGATTASSDTTAPGSRWPLIATGVALGILAAAGWLLFRNKCQRA